MKEPQTRRRREQWAWCMYDWANSAYVTTVAVAVLPAYFAAAVVPADGYVVWGTRLTAASLWGYLMSAVALAVFVLAPFLGAVADGSGSRKRFLAVFCMSGAAAAAGLFFIGPGMVWPTMILFAVAHVGFVGGNVFYDAFLPHIAKVHEYDRVSGRGFALGYAGGGLQFALALALVAFHAQLGLGEGQAARLAMLMAALWWAGFALIPLRGLSEPPGRDLPGSPRGAALVAAHAVRAARGLSRTTARIRELPGLGTFLVAFLLYNDGIQTTIAMATIYGRQELGLPTAWLMGTLLMIQFVAIFGARLFSALAGRVTARRALMLAVAMWTGVVLYAWRMDSAGEYFVLGGLVGLVLGGSQALSRSIYARLVPVRSSAEFFGYYSVVNRLSSVAGPFVFAVVTQATGSSRGALPVLAVFFVLGLFFLWRLKIPDSSRS